MQNPRAFLFRVAANLAVDNLRKMRTLRETLSIEPPPENMESPAPSTEEALDAKQRLQQLDAAIGELSPKCRRALLLNRLEGKTHREIAQNLGVSESMVAKYIIQALKHCHARLEPEESPGHECCSRLASIRLIEYAGVVQALSFISGSIPLW